MNETVATYFRVLNELDQMREEEKMTERLAGGGKHEGYFTCNSCRRQFPWGPDWAPIVNGRLEADVCLECYRPPAVRPTPTKCSTRNEGGKK